MFVAMPEGMTHKVKHSGNVIDAVVNGSYQVIDQSMKAIDKASSWSNLQLTAGEQRVFAEAAHQLRFADAEGKVATPITVEQLLAPRRAEDANPATYRPYRSGNVAATDLWKTFNVVQENVIKGGLHGVARGTDEHGRITHRNVTTREVRGIDQDVKLNRALWHLAERMAELKGVGSVA
jgi:hypothetical protein